jgi:pimeloyl-ACP methyl ester carboxylesterase
MFKQWLCLLLLISTFCEAQVPRKAELVLINGKQLYYEMYGEGEPLIMLHGYSLFSQSWLPYVENYKEDYQVYLIDLTGHGKSEAFKSSLNIASVGEDLNALLDYLKLDSIKAIGFSFGGDVLYQLALNHPSNLKSMITIGAVGTWSVNDFPDYLETFIFENIADFPWLRTFHSSDTKIKGILSEFKNYTVSLSDEELKSIQPEVLIMLGDDDIGIPLEEVARVRRFLPNSDLWILPNVSHSAHEGETKPAFIEKSKAFLSKD